MIKAEEFRCDDGKGSWHRKGVSITDRRLLEVEESFVFARNQDFLRFIPDSIVVPFTNKVFAKSLGISVYQAVRVTYTLRRMKVIEMVGKEGNAYLYDIIV
jgi:hypothetical protein